MFVEDFLMGRLYPDPCSFVTLVGVSEVVLGLCLAAAILDVVSAESEAGIHYHDRSTLVSA